jgi:hypothetical protein
MRYAGRQYIPERQPFQNSELLKHISIRLTGVDRNKCLTNRLKYFNRINRASTGGEFGAADDAIRGIRHFDIVMEKVNVILETSLFKSPSGPLP